MARGVVLQTVSILVTLLSRWRGKLGVLGTSRLTLSPLRHGRAAFSVSFQLAATARQKGGGMGRARLESSLDLLRGVPLWLPERRRGEAYSLLLRFHLPVLLTSRSVLLWPNFPASVCALCNLLWHVFLAPFPPAAKI